MTTKIVSLFQDTDGVTRIGLSTGTILRIEGDNIIVTNPNRPVKTLEKGRIKGPGVGYYIHELEVL